MNIAQYANKTLNIAKENMDEAFNHYMNCPQELQEFQNMNITKEQFINHVNKSIERDNEYKKMYEIERNCD